MKRMAVSNVLIVGVQGLGAEIGVLLPIHSKIAIQKRNFSQERRFSWC
jgi:hypothetical protein